MKNILVIFLFALIASSALSQSSGIFLSTKCVKGSDRHTVMITNKQICLAPNPLLLPGELISIGDVVSQKDKVWFDLVVSPKAVLVMSQISENLPNAVFALVVENKVFYTFPAADVTPNRTFRFQGTAREMNTFANMQKRLKVLIENSSPQ